MASIFSWLAPIFGGFLIGYLAKRFKLVDTKHGNWLLKFAFYVTIPALSLVSVAQVSLVPELIIFTLLPAILLCATFPVAKILSKRAHVPRVSEGVILSAPMTINSAMVMSFAIAAFGQEGALRVILFNAGFNPLLFLWVYALMISYSPNSSGKYDAWKKIALAPPVWALVAGLALNLTNTEIPPMLADILRTVGGTTALITIVALGTLFNPAHAQRAIALRIVATRMLLGLAVGLTIVTLLQMQGIDRALVLALAVAPIGFNIMTFASLQRLDSSLAASAVSYSVPIGLIAIPLIILLASQ